MAWVREMLLYCDLFLWGGMKSRWKWPLLYSSGPLPFSRLSSYLQDFTYSTFLSYWIRMNFHIDYLLCFNCAKLQSNCARLRSSCARLRSGCIQTVPKLRQTAPDCDQAASDCVLDFQVIILSFNSKIMILKWKMSVTVYWNKTILKKK